MTLADKLGLPWWRKRLEEEMPAALRPKPSGPPAGLGAPPEGDASKADPRGAIAPLVTKGYSCSWGSGGTVGRYDIAETHLQAGVPTLSLFEGSPAPVRRFSRIYGTYW